MCADEVPDSLPVSSLENTSDSLNSRVDTLEARCSKDQIRIKKLMTKVSKLSKEIRELEEHTKNAVTYIDNDIHQAKIRAGHFFEEGGKKLLKCERDISRLDAHSKIQVIEDKPESYSKVPLVKEQSYFIKYQKQIMTTA
jgi:transcription initiation factor IIE alpha subunit